jgi:alkylation response protein AidB-like acyl-CoA dehydrogenase
VVADRLGPKAVRDLDDAERAAKLDAAVDASGWRELRVAAEGSRPLASAVEAALVAEELSRALADTAFLGPTLAADLRRLAGADPATGVETVALMPDLSAAAEATGGALPDGAVAVDSRQAAAALVLVPSDGGHRLGRIALKEGEGGTDLTRPSIFVPPGTEVAPVEPGGDVLSAEDRQRWTALGLALTSAELVGVMRGMIEVATDYARSRRQYGVPIGSFQAVQHLLADALVAMEGSRSAALHAAWAVDALPPD